MGKGKKETASQAAAVADHNDAREEQDHEQKDEAEVEETAEKFERWSSHFANHVEVEVNGHLIRLRQDPSEEMLEETGSTVWDIGRVLALVLHRDRELSRRIKGKRIVELGSGLSVCLFSFCLSVFFLEICSSVFPQDVDCWGLCWP